MPPKDEPAQNQLNVNARTGQACVGKSLWARKEDMPCELRLLVGTLEEREQESIKQGITEAWETTVRLDQGERCQRRK